MRASGETGSAIPAEAPVGERHRNTLGRTVSEGRSALAQHDFGVVIDDGAGKAFCREFYAKCMGSPPSTFMGLASLVFPVFLAEKRNINSPDHHSFPSLDNPGRIDQIPPDDVPARVVVVRLQGSGARVAF